MSQVIAQAKILRVLKLVGLLRSRSKTVAELAEILDTTPRSIYRYLQLLEEVGFIIDKDFNKRYFIHAQADEEEMNFNENEATLLKEIIETSAKDHPLKSVLLQKLYVNSDLKTVAQNLLSARTGVLVQVLANCIKYENQVALKKYQSARSNEISDRVIEPIYFTDNYESIVGLDIKDKLIKHFKLERIGDVESLDKPIRFKARHERAQTDCFGMGGQKEVWVVLELNLRAYLLLKEEYPNSIPYLQEEKGRYFFQGPVLSFEGVGRFVMGLMEFVRIIKPKALAEHLNNKIASKQF